jgi:phosphoribosylamine--glycine ligase
MANMNVLVVGSGGREHALTWKIRQSPLVKDIFCAPGNAGTAMIAKNLDVEADDLGALAMFAAGNRIGLTVVGPEAPLCNGIADLFTSAGLPVFGPSLEAARLEGSKAFMKKVATAAGIPTPRYELHTDYEKAVAALERFPGGVVVKADGLAAGKGVVVCGSRDQAVAAIDRMLVRKEFGLAGATVVLEEKIEGEEASILLFCAGENYRMIPSLQDHKRIGDGDTGPNTGGMGAYSPAPVVTPEILARIEREIIRPAVSEMLGLGTPYKGLLYAGVMITAEGPKLLEFNCRFGDPECQPIVMRLKSDIVPVMLACAEGELEDDLRLEWDPRVAVCVVMAAGGYPGEYARGKLIGGLDEAGAAENAMVFHAGTRLTKEGVVTNGGRVLGVTAMGATVRDAVDTAYKAVGKIHWEGAVWRKDIAKKALSR